MDIWTLITLIGFMGVFVPMFIVCVVGDTDPSLETRRAYRTVKIVLHIAFVSVAVMLTGIIGGVL